MDSKDVIEEKLNDLELTDFVVRKLRMHRRNSFVTLTAVDDERVGWARGVLSTFLLKGESGVRFISRSSILRLG